MADTLFLVFAVMYAVVAIKVDQWQTISMLGFKSETPQMFLQSPRIYHQTRVALFTGAVVASYFATTIPWYIALGIVAATWFGGFWLGRKFAFNTFRQVHRDLISYEESIKNSDPNEYALLIHGEDPETHRAELEAGARISEEKLLERIERSLKWGV